jgi:hypothetical protein
MSQILPNPVVRNVISFMNCQFLGPLRLLGTQWNEGVMEVCEGEYVEFMREDRKRQNNAPENVIFEGWNQFMVGEDEEDPMWDWLDRKKWLVSEIWTDDVADVAHVQVWLKNGGIHRDGDMPAHIETWNVEQYEDIGPVEVRSWYQNGVIERKEGPARICVCGGKVISQVWFKNGVKHRDNDEPAVVGKLWFIYQEGLSNLPEVRQSVTFGGAAPGLDITHSEASEWEHGGVWMQNGAIRRDNGLPTIQVNRYKERGTVVPGWAFWLRQLRDDEMMRLRNYSKFLEREGEKPFVICENGWKETVYFCSLHNSPEFQTVMATAKETEIKENWEHYSKLQFDKWYLAPEYQQFSRKELKDMDYINEEEEEEEYVNSDEESEDD